MGTALDLLARQHREPILDEIDPGRAGGCEVHVEPRVSEQPQANRGRFVRAVIIENQVDLVRDRHAGVDLIQELSELERAMPPMALADDLPGLNDQRGEERRGAVADVIVRAAFRRVGAQRQDRLAAIQSLDLRLLVNAQDQRVVWGMQVEPSTSVTIH